MSSKINIQVINKNPANKRLRVIFATRYVQPCKMRDKLLKTAIIIISGLSYISVSYGQSEVKEKTITEIKFSKVNDTIIRVIEYDSTGKRINLPYKSVEFSFCTKIITIDSSESRILKEHYFDNGYTNFSETLINNQIETIRYFDNQDDTIHFYTKNFNKNGCLTSMSYQFDYHHTIYYKFKDLKEYSDFETLHNNLYKTEFETEGGFMKIDFNKREIKYYILSKKGKKVLRDKIYFDKYYLINERINYLFHDFHKKTFKTKTIYSFNKNQDLIQLKVIDNYGEIERLKIIEYDYY